MELKLLKLAVERLYDQIEQLTGELEKVKAELANVKTIRPITEVPSMIPESVSLVGEYLDSKEVQKILGVCYNTLQKIVKNGDLKSIRVNQRRIRYSKADVIQYLKQNSR